MLKLAYFTDLGYIVFKRTRREEKPVPFSKSLWPPFNFLSHWPIFHTISIRSWRSWAEKLYFCVGAHSEWEKLTPFSSNLSTMVLNRSCFWFKSLSIFWGALSQLGLSSTTQMHFNQRFRHTLFKDNPRNICFAWAIKTKPIVF